MMFKLKIGLLVIVIIPLVALTICWWPKMNVMHMLSFPHEAYSTLLETAAHRYGVYDDPEDIIILDAFNPRTNISEIEQLLEKYPDNKYLLHRWSLSFNRYINCYSYNDDELVYGYLDSKVLLPACDKLISLEPDNGYYDLVKCNRYLEAYSPIEAAKCLKNSLNKNNYIIPSLDKLFGDDYHSFWKDCYDYSLNQDNQYLYNIFNDYNYEIVQHPEFISSLQKYIDKRLINIDTCDWLGARLKQYVNLTIFRNKNSSIENKAKAIDEILKCIIIREHDFYKVGIDLSCDCNPFFREDIYRRIYILFAWISGIFLLIIAYNLVVAKIISKIISKLLPFKIPTSVKTKYVFQLYIVATLFCWALLVFTIFVINEAIEKDNDIFDYQKHIVENLKDISDLQQEYYNMVCKYTDLNNELVWGYHLLILSDENTEKYLNKYKFPSSEFQYRLENWLLSATQTQKDIILRHIDNNDPELQDILLKYNAYSGDQNAKNTIKDMLSEKTIKVQNLTSFYMGEKMVGNMIDGSEEDNNSEITTEDYFEYCIYCYNANSSQENTIWINKIFENSGHTEGFVNAIELCSYSLPQNSIDRIIKDAINIANQSNLTNEQNFSLTNIRSMEESLIKWKLDFIANNAPLDSEICDQIIYNYTCKYDETYIPTFLKMLNIRADNIKDIGLRYLGGMMGPPGTTQEESNQHKKDINIIDKTKAAYTYRSYAVWQLNELGYEWTNEQKEELLNDKCWQVRFNMIRVANIEQLEKFTKDEQATVRLAAKYSLVQ